MGKIFTFRNSDKYVSVLQDDVDLRERLPDSVAQEMA